MRDPLENVVAIPRNALTLVAPIRPGEVDALTAFLNEVGEDVPNNPHIAFEELTTTHFLRWAVVANDPAYPPQLVFESNYDGTLEAHLDELVRVAGRSMDAIYGRCEGYPTAGSVQPGRVKEYLRQHAIPYAAFYQGYPNVSVNEIRENARIRAAIEAFLDQHREELFNLPEEQVHARVVEHVRRQGLPTDAPPAPRSKLTEVLDWVLSHRLVLVPVGLLLLPVLAPLAAVVFLLERADGADAKKRDVVDKRLLAKEDHLVQNQLTHVVELKPGRLRRWLLKAVLAGIDFMAIYYFNRGTLGGIGSIHFARWAFIDGDRRLLFFSNYDGSWENYLGDFIDRASIGLTGVWSNTRGFPKALLLFFSGARNEDAFKHWTRNHQVPTQVWYSAHGGESVQNILNSAAIRAGLRGAKSRDEARRWLGRL